MSTMSDTLDVDLADSQVKDRMINEICRMMFPEGFMPLNSLDSMVLAALVEGVLPGVKALRHDIHSHPEIALAEFETRKRLKAYLGEGFRYRDALLGTDLILEIPGGGPGCRWL